MAAKVSRTPLVAEKDTFVILTTAGSSREAKHLARLLLKKRCAACINLLPKIQSWYWWEGKIEHSAETLLLIKTSKQKLGRLAQLLKASHSYAVPELIALPISWGDRVYLNWLKKSVQETPDR